MKFTTNLQKWSSKPCYLAKDDVVWSRRAYTAINHLENNTSSKNSLSQIRSAMRGRWSGLAATGRGWRRWFFLGNRHQRPRFDSVFPIFTQNWCNLKRNLGFIAFQYRFFGGKNRTEEKVLCSILHFHVAFAGETKWSNF